MSYDKSPINPEDFNLRAIHPKEPRPVIKALTHHFNDVIRTGKTDWLTFDETRIKDLATKPGSRLWIVEQNPEATQAYPWEHTLGRHGILAAFNTTLMSPNDSLWENAAEHLQGTELPVLGVGKIAVNTALYGQGFWRQVGFPLLTQRAGERGYEKIAFDARQLPVYRKIYSNLGATRVGEGTFFSKTANAEVTEDLWIYTIK